MHRRALTSGENLCLDTSMWLSSQSSEGVTSLDLWLRKDGDV